MIGPKMKKVIQFVTENPGKIIREAAKEAGAGQSAGYDVVSRCLRAGLIRREPGPVTSSWLLYPPKQKETPNE
jgi:hypothetical protein